MRSITLVLVTLLVVLLLLALSVLLVVYSGAYNVAATDGHRGLVTWLLTTTTDRSIVRQARGVGQLVLPIDSTSMGRGHRAYEQMCVVCHGAPGIDRGWMGQGMTPRPPDLAESARVRSVDEIYWVIQHGIKFAGMPALLPTHTEDEIKELTSFVTSLAEMDEAEYAAWRRAAEVDTSAVADDGHDHTH